MSTRRPTNRPGALSRRICLLLSTVGAALPAVAQDDAAGRVRAQPDTKSPAPVQPAPAPPTAVQPITPPGAGGAPTGAPAPKLPPAGRQPPAGKPDVKPDEITFSDFTEPVDLRALVEWVGETLNINIAATEGLTGTVVLNAPITVKRDRLLDLLNALLEQQNYTIYHDPQTNWYFVRPATGITSTFEGGLATTRLIATPGIRPSSLAPIVSDQMGGAQGTALHISYLDDLGVILFTDTPRRIATLQTLVDRLLERSREQEFIRFEVQYLAASVARQRILELLGQASAGASPTIQGQVVPPGPAAAGAANSSNAATQGFESRLNVDAQGNALILRGYPDEAQRIERVLAVIDRPKFLEYRQYFAGSAATQIAEMAQRQGLGSVEVIDSTPEQHAGSTPTLPNQPAIRGQTPVQFPGLGNTNQTSSGGPMMIVDTARGLIFYYGTPSQQHQLAGLIKTLDTEREQVVIAAYKLKNVPSDDVADLLTAMINGQAGGGSSGSAFLPNSLGGGGSRSRSSRSGSSGSNGQNQNGLSGLSGLGNQSGSGSQRQPRGNVGGVGTASSGSSPFGPGDVFVISDRGNNQVLIKAPAKQQPDFSKLIAKIDQRRPQVYIEVQIVAVSASDDFRLAVEVQAFNAGGKGGAVNTNFGLGTLTSTTTTGTGDTATTSTSGDFLSRKSVATNLSGITAAIIRSDQVPIVINALKRDTDTRILSSPQLLVDDNETAEIVSLEEQPTTSTSQGTSTTQTSFQGFESAGTRLNVTPSISEGGYMRLSYEVELSNFVGTGTNGIPPVRQTRNVNSDSVTIPGDTTIVVGGIKVDSKSSTIAKVPFLGDIPLLGTLFRDTSKTASNTRLYVFITPRLMRDPNFRDLMLLTRGPQAEAGIALDVPDLKPAFMRMVEPAPWRAPVPERPDEPARQEPARGEDRAAPFNPAAPSDSRVTTPGTVSPTLRGDQSSNGGT